LSGVPPRCIEAARNAGGTAGSRRESRTPVPLLE
jgi:hypothetical protein